MSVFTAYAIRSPFGSAERGVGCPRVVVGEAAQMASDHGQLGCDAGWKMARSGPDAIDMVVTSLIENCEADDVKSAISLDRNVWNAVTRAR